MLLPSDARSYEIFPVVPGAIRKAGVTEPEVPGDPPTICSALGL